MVLWGRIPNWSAVPHLASALGDLAVVVTFAEETINKNDISVALIGVIYILVNNKHESCLTTR